MTQNKPAIVSNNVEQFSTYYEMIWEESIIKDLFYRAEKRAQLGGSCIDFPFLRTTLWDWRKARKRKVGFLFSV